MEALYSKLYDKYTKLKTKKWSELDDVNKDQEEKFMTYVTVAEEFIQHLQTENERLRSQANDLRSELASVRSTQDEQCTEYQKLLMEENRKNKELSEEVERLRNLQQVENFSRLKDSKMDNGEVCTPASAQVSAEEVNQSNRRKTYKRRRHSRSETEDIVMPSNSRQDNEILRESGKDLQKEALPSGALITVHQPQCCRTIERPGGKAECLFQVLAEYLVGLKFSTVNQTEEICISAVHQSSGYSFSLTWMKSAAGKEAVLEYRVLSLGTLERVAPYWMKDVIMFSTTMCPIFFERLSCVVQLHPS